MFSSDFHIDRHIPALDLKRAFAAGFGVQTEEVAVVDEGDYDAVGDHWDDLTVKVLLRQSIASGDFPLALRISTRNDQPRDLLAVLKTIAGELGAPILTDEIGSQYDDDFLLVAPSGATAIVMENLDEPDGDEPAIVLVPESRAIYESLVHRPLVSAR